MFSKTKREKKSNLWLDKIICWRRDQNANGGHSLVSKASLKYFLQYQTYLGIYIARVTQQRLNNLRVSFVNSDMQRRAFVFVAPVSICASFQQGGGCWRLITNGKEKKNI